jgi:hypothetical protein
MGFGVASFPAVVTCYLKFIVVWLSKPTCLVLLLLLLLLLL